MYGIYAKIDGKCYHIWHTWILWEMIGCIPVLRKSTFSGSKLFDHPPVVRRENARPSYRDATKRPDVEMGRWSNSWSVTWMTYGASLSKNLHISGANYVGSYPIGSMVLPYMLTWIPSIYPSHVSINIPAPWILWEMEITEISQELHSSDQSLRFHFRTSQLKKIHP
jgi:hypothetical protein